MYILYCSIRKQLTAIKKATKGTWYQEERERGK